MKAPYLLVEIAIKYINVKYVFLTERQKPASFNHQPESPVVWIEGMDFGGPITLAAALVWKRQKDEGKSIKLPRKRIPHHPFVAVGF